MSWPNTPTSGSAAVGPDRLDELVPTESPPDGALRAILAALEADSVDRVGPAAPRLVVIPLYDQDGRVEGGLWGCTVFQWLHIQFLVIPESRRRHGLGSILMGLAETEARLRGCVGAHVSTFSFQAVPFYEKLGYGVFGTLKDYPPGHALVHLCKRLDAPPAGQQEDLTGALDHARRFAATGADEAAKQAYTRVLRIDPTHRAALNEIAALAWTGGHRAAARTAYAQAARFHPGDPAAHVGLGNLALEDGDAAAARPHFEAALAADSRCPQAHQGMAHALTQLGGPVAEPHWSLGFEGHAVVTRPARSVGPGIPLLLLVAARGGNIPTRHWIDDRRFAVTAIHVDYHDPARPPPPCALTLNAIGDADLCEAALRRAEHLLADSTAPLINPPSAVLRTGRAANARRLSRIPGVIASRTERLTRLASPAASGLEFPLLLRAEGFHSGKHFVLVPDRGALRDAVASLPGDHLLAMRFLDASGPDGMTRKYRVMFVDGVMYPAHLAIGRHWKLHYFSSAMAENAAHRDEERRFLEDMPNVLGAPAMAALARIGAALGLDYGGVDFGLARDGSVLLFEANATMVAADPGPDPKWRYRRPAAGAVRDAMRRMLIRRATG